ncbi:RNase A-like domain-containing protein [Streptomyces sp. NPDC102274]|uniref:RNase A-like domain-containing protein n=1 Tax=Streptomyces sp. NPDC102274 TaxID=3366151 RepID=UPI00381D2DC3
MARRHPSGFEVVGYDNDPAPGDIDEMNRVRDRYQSIGDEAETALNFLKKGGQVETGRGEAMNKLREHISDLPDKLQKTVTSYHDAADAYTTYGPQLVEAQDLLDKAMDQALEVGDQANQTPPTLPDDATDQQKSDNQKQKDQIAQANLKMTGAKLMAGDAAAMREKAKKACEDVLYRAAGEAIPERSFFQKVADFFKDFPFVQILLGALIAITSIFFPVAGALLGGALFAFTTIVGAATGTLSLGDILTGLVGLIPGGSLVKLGGKAVTAIGGAAKGLPGAAKFVGGAGAAGSAFGKATGSITKIGDSIKNSKSIQGILNHPVTQIGKEGVKEGAENAAEEAATEVIDGEGLDAGNIANAGALGLAGGALGAGASTFGKKSPFPQKGPAAGSSGGGGTRAQTGGSQNNTPQTTGAQNTPTPQNNTPQANTSSPQPQTTPPTAGPATAGAAGAAGAAAAAGGIPTKTSTTPVAGSSTPGNQAPTPATHVPTTNTGLNSPFSNFNADGLTAHEVGTGSGNKGHAIDRHVAKDDAFLQGRLNGQPGGPGQKPVRPIPVASTFNTLGDADKATADNLSQHSADIQKFLNSPPPPPTKKGKVPLQRSDFTSFLPPGTGAKSLTKDSNGNFAQTSPTKVTTVIEKDSSAPDGFRIITSFPTS